MPDNDGNNEYRLREQPEVYSTLKDLLEWLAWDLLDQANRGRRNEELRLDIGSSTGIEKKIIRFDFNFDKIVSILLKTKDENWASICPYIVNCSNVVFEMKANFEFVKFQNTVYFRDANFHYEANFRYAYFQKQVYFYGAEFQDNANFLHTIFLIADSQDGDIADIVDVLKKTSIELAHASYEDIGEFIYAFKQTNFCHAKFQGIANFQQASFHNGVDFSNACFHSEVNYLCTTFQAISRFENTTFRNNAYFHSATLENILKFDNIKLNEESYISFRNINSIFEQKESDSELKLQGAEIRKNSKIEIKNTIITGRIDFNQVYINKINFSNTVVIGNGVISTDDLKVEKYASWKTARFLKHEAIKISNTIDALKFQAAEKDLYKKYVKAGRKEIEPRIKETENRTLKYFKMFFSWVIRPFRWISRFFNDRAEIFSIWLSKLSNNHGQNWGQAVLFTVISALCFFTVFSFITCLATDALNTFLKLFDPDISISIIDFFDPIKLEIMYAEFFSSLVDYYIPINYEGITSYLDCGDTTIGIRILTTIVYLLGKIAIAYGIVEVVQAFRKLK